jgi:hypothetical protein
VSRLPDTIATNSATDLPRNSMRRLNSASGTVPKALMRSINPTTRMMSVSSGTAKKRAASGAPSQMQA